MSPGRRPRGPCRPILPLALLALALTQALHPLALANASAGDQGCGTCSAAPDDAAGTSSRECSTDLVTPAKGATNTTDTPAYSGAWERELVDSLLQWMMGKEGGEVDPSEGDAGVRGSEKSEAFEVVVGRPANPKRCCNPPEEATPSGDAGADSESQGQGEKEEGNEETELHEEDAVRAPIGLAAARDLASGEVVLRIPRSAVVFRSPVAEEAVPYQGKQLGLAMLASFLLRERARGEGSPWAPYIRSLPRAHYTHPLLFDPSMLAEFQYAPFVEEVSRLQKLVAMDYSKVDNPEAIGHATLEEYKWAYTMVMSRLFSISSVAVGKPKGGTPKKLDYLDSTSAMASLVPVGDLIDHSSDPNLTWELKSDHLSFTTTRPVHAGEALSHSYGNKSNTQLMASYGFLAPGNPGDGAQLFKSAKSVAVYYSTWRAGDGFAVGNKDDCARYKAVARKASNVSQELWKVLQSEPRFLPGRGLRWAMSVMEQSSLNAWPGNFIDPELLTILMSLASTDYATFRVEPNYMQLARLASTLGFDTGARGGSDTTCSIIRAHLEERADRDAVAAAGQAIMRQAETLLARARESIEEDERILQLLQGCAEGRPPERWDLVEGQATGALCKRGKEMLEQYELAVRFRLWKKHTLLELKDCCHWECENQASGDASDDGGVSGAGTSTSTPTSFRETDVDDELKVE